MPNITLRVRGLIIALFMTVAVAGYGNIANAGLTEEFASCMKTPLGAGRCQGTFAGFRNHSDPGAYVYFYAHRGTRFFQARLNGVTYVARPIGSAILAMWDTALSHRGYFKIDWDDSGIIVNLYLTNGSQYSTF